MRDRDDEHGSDLTIRLPNGDKYVVHLKDFPGIARDYIATFVRNRIMHGGSRESDSFAIVKELDSFLVNYGTYEMRNTKDLGVGMRRHGFPRIWELFSFILDKQTRERVYEPLYNDMLEKHLESRRFRSKWAKRWLGFAFTVRTACMVLDCARVTLIDRPLHWLRQYLPELIFLRG